jgi:virulence factor Mce-like protein
MLTRMVRAQLIIFAIASLVGLTTMAVNYIRVPTLLGIGRITVTMELPASGGLYRFGNVTYRGSQIGTVTDLRLTRTGAEATLSLDTSPKIPESLEAAVRNVSAVGEQYVDLRPNTDSGPYLVDGSVIPLQSTSIPQPTGPTLDRMERLVDSIPETKLGELLDESYNAFNGSGYDFGSLVDSFGTLAADLKGVSGQTRELIDDSVPLLDAQARSADSMRTWMRSLTGVTEQLRENEPQIRTILNSGPGFAQELSGLLSGLKPTLPVLLANLTTIGQILVTYNPSLEQLLVLLPPHIAATQSQGAANNTTGIAQGDFALTMGDPTPCTVGYLPPSAWRSPADTSDADTPDGLYCKLPQDSPIAVRGARNFPCMEHPGKRAPTVEICNSDKPFMPLAIRQHALGAYPLDPSLIAQGVPLDGRVDGDERIHAPVAGTPMPPGERAPSPPGGGAPAAPSAFDRDESGSNPVAVATYDPFTGRYLGADQRLYQQAGLTPASLPKSWTDLMPT